MVTKYRRTLKVSAQAIPLRAFIAYYKMLDDADSVGQVEARAPFSVVPFVVLAAFSIEAYLNSLGSRQIKTWESLERISWRSKINLLHEIARREPNWNEKPLRFAVEVFAIRNGIAHAKPETVISKRLVDDPEQIDRSEHLWPDWINKIDLAWAVASRYELEKLLSYLGNLFGYPEKDQRLVSDEEIEIVELGNG